MQYWKPVLHFFSVIHYVYNNYNKGENIMLQIIQKTHTDGIHKYLEYTYDTKDPSGNKKEISVNNAEYLMVDVTTEKYKEIAGSTGGFCAYMTRRYIKSLLPKIVRYILFCPIPRQTNEFCFLFIYLDKDKNILADEYNSDVWDWTYFTDKFNDCACEKGFVYDLASINSLDPITKQIADVSSPEFDFKIDGKPVYISDAFEADMLRIFNKKTQKALSELNAKKIIFKFDPHHTLKVQIYVKNKDGEFILNDMVNIKCGYKIKLENIDRKDFVIEETSVDILKRLADINKLKFYNED